MANEKLYVQTMKTRISTATTSCPKAMTRGLVAACAKGLPALCAAMLLLPGLRAQGAAVLTTLHSFGVFPDGEYPTAGLVQGSDGNLYGTTPSGGTNGGNGTVFRFSTNGVISSLYSFAGGNDGANPFALLVQGNDGNFYGTTYLGGTSNLGTAFKISAGGTLSTLWQLGGIYPSALVQGSDGSLYGTMYGTTTHGGTNNGTVFKISPSGALTTLYAFTGGTDGGSPIGLVQGSDGRFYGTTQVGGTNNDGTVFNIDAHGVLGSLYSFTGGNDGATPAGGLVQGSDGSLYGTTENGGAHTNQYGGCGTVFKLNPSGTLSILWSFTGGGDGAFPVSGLVQGIDGILYGTTQGGTNGVGTVFRINSSGALTTLYSFTGGSDGSAPSGLVLASDGNLYGTTQVGGTNGAGNVFRISPSGVFTSFSPFTGGDDGANPGAELVQGSDGNFYGTTAGGGTVGYGTVFRMTTNGIVNTLYSFGTVPNTYGSLDGASPFCALVQGSDGYFYGTTLEFGASVEYGEDCGTVFKISTNGALTTLYSFGSVQYALDGAGPWAGLVRGIDGNFYGMTDGGGTNGHGTVFKISPSGALTTLYSFTGGNDGADPRAGLVQGSDGSFYGTTYSGGAYTNYGTVFKVNVAGTLATLYSFTGGNDGAGPEGLVQGSAGSFYGTTYGGGTSNLGTTFKIGVNGVMTALCSFSGGSDGANPWAGLVQGSDGNFYGTTYNGGEGGFGTVFRLSLVWATPVFQPVTLTDGVVGLTWSTEPGGTYQMQYNSDLNSTNWTNLGAAVTATGSTLSTTDPATNNPPRFYRVVVLP